MHKAGWLGNPMPVFFFSFLIWILRLNQDYFSEAKPISRKTEKFNNRLQFIFNFIPLTGPVNSLTKKYLIKIIK